MFVFVLPWTASTDLCLEAFFERLLRINDPHSLLVSATEDKGLVSTREQKGWQEKGKENTGGKKIEDGKKQGWKRSFLEERKTLSC